MFSFVDENRASLVDFFAVALAVRKEATAGPVDNLIKWSKDVISHDELIIKHAPILVSASDTFRGIHATAYAFDSCVVKTNLFGEWKFDGQCQWLQWCLQHQGNPLVPKIAMLLTDADTNRFLVVMERLVAHAGFQNHEFRKEIDEALRASFERNGGGFFNLAKTVKSVKANSLMAVEELRADIDLMKEIEDQVCEELLTEQLTNHQITLSYIEQLEALWRSLTHERKSEYAEIRQQFRTYVNDGHLIDLHSLNWMLRANGEQVLLDPVN